MADYFGFDGKLWRTLAPLATRPGLLTNEYLRGRRNHYVRPVRLYLTASLALFFLLSILPEGGFLSGAVMVKDDGAAYRLSGCIGARTRRSLRRRSVLACRG